MSINDNEDNAFSDLDDDFPLFVQNILDKYLYNNYTEGEKDQLCQQLEMIIQDQANDILQLLTNIIYQTQIKYRISSFFQFHQ